MPTPLERNRSLSLQAPTYNEKGWSAQALRCLAAIAGKTDSMNTLQGLTAFEQYMLTDDRELHPMTFTIRLKFAGQFERRPFAEAVATAVGRHPLLASHIVGADTNHPQWVEADDPMPPIDIAPLGCPLEFPGSERIDLARCTGLRIWVRSGSDRTEMRFQFHHSCTDGIGAYRFIEDVLCAYEAAVHGDVRSARFRPLDKNRLPRRAKFGLSRFQVLLRLPQEAWGAVVGAATFFLRRPQPLISPEIPHGDQQSRLELLDYPAHAFTPEESNAYHVAARRWGVKLNDLLLCDTLLAADGWNRRLGSRGWHPIRVAVPVDLRVAGDERLPACNVAAMVFLDRTPRWYLTTRHLLRTTRWETRFIKRFRLALSFIRICNFVSYVPGGLKWLTRANHCYTTAVMSNMGRPLSQAPLPKCGEKLCAGRLRLESVESAPPVRPFTAAGFTALTYSGRLTLVMNYDRHHFTAETARSFFDCVVQQIRCTATMAA